MLSNRGVPPFLIRTTVTGDSVASVKALNRVVGDPDLHLLLDQGVRHRVIMAVYGDVVIDVHPRIASVKNQTHSRIVSPGLLCG